MRSLAAGLMATVNFYFSTCIKDAAIAIRLSRARNLFYTARSGNGFEGMEAVWPRIPNHVDPTGIKNLFCFTERYVEDVKQDEKHVPDLLEAIMKPTDPVKEGICAK